MSSKKVLLLAYMISPYKGSEYSVAWNYISEMSNENKLVVLYGASGNHMGDISELEEFTNRSPILNARFVPVIPNKITKSLNFLNKKGIFSYSFYFAYHQWHKQAYKVAQELIKNENFDLIHYLGPIGYREPGLLWKIDLPYIWGPIGGATNISLNLINALTFKGKIKLLLRAFINNLQLKYNRNVHNALKRTDLLLTATIENQEIFKKIHHVDSLYITENCIREEIKIKKEKFTDKDKLHFVWIGSIEPRKALKILIESLILIKNRTNFIIDIIGNGPLKSELQSYAILHGLDNCIKWHGNIPRNEVINLLSMSHLNIITSVSEGNPTTIWEAMSLGVPTITLNHCGMKDTICSKCGIKIEITTYSQIIKDFAKEIENLVTNSERLEILSKGVLDCSKNYLWDDRRILFNNLYDKAVTKWNSKKNI